MTPLKHIHERLYIGNDEDALRILRTKAKAGSIKTWQEPDEGWAIVHAAKSPWHTALLNYTGPAPISHPERWYAQRDRRTFLNLVDSPSQLAQLVLPILDYGIGKIDEYVDQGLKVLIHCNMGLSRSPAVVMWWRRGTEGSLPDFKTARSELAEDHPYVKWDSGIMKLVQENWD